jgi:hypothetical protein
MSGSSLPPPCPPSWARSESERESARPVLVPSKMEQNGDVDIGTADALGAVEGIISGGTTPTKPPRPLLSCSAAEPPHHTPRDGRDNWIESEFVHLEGQVCARM